MCSHEFLAFQHLLIQKYCHDLTKTNKGNLIDSYIFPIDCWISIFMAQYVSKYKYTVLEKYD